MVISCVQTINKSKEQAQAIQEEQLKNQIEKRGFQLTFIDPLN